MHEPAKIMVLHSGRGQLKGVQMSDCVYFLLFSNDRPTHRDAKDAPGTRVGGRFQKIRALRAREARAAYFII